MIPFNLDLLLFRRFLTTCKKTTLLHDCVTPSKGTMLDVTNPLSFLTAPVKEPQALHGSLGR